MTCRVRVLCVCHLTATMCGPGDHSPGWEQRWPHGFLLSRSKCGGFRPWAAGALGGSPPPRMWGCEWGELSPGHSEQTPCFLTWERPFSDPWGQLFPAPHSCGTRMRACGVGLELEGGVLGVCAFVFMNNWSKIVTKEIGQENILCEPGTEGPLHSRADTLGLGTSAAVCLHRLTCQLADTRVMGAWLTGALLCSGVRVCSRTTLSPLSRPHEARGPRPCLLPHALGLL